MEDSLEAGTTYVSHRNKKSKRNPWTSNDLVNAINDKNDLYKQSKNRPYNITLKNKLNESKKLVKRLIARDKKLYYNDKLINAKNSRETWMTLNELTKNSKNDHKEDIILKIENDLISDQNMVAKEFVHYFSTVGESIANAITKTHQNPELTLKCTSMTSMFLHKTNKNEVINVIGSLKVNSAPGEDEICNNFLKSCHLEIADMLVDLINMAVEYGQFPDELKIAKVIPLYKLSGEKTQTANYRPISLLPAVSKIFEKIMYNRLENYLEKINFLSDVQYGFRKKKNTQIAALDLITYLQQHLDKGYIAAGLFIDLQKAFDTVYIPTLLKKLEVVGVRGRALDIFKSYLSNRKQFVQINNYKSDVLDINYGVPQGSILGPLLFSIYINDITKSNLEGDVRLYADDTCILYVHKNLNIITDTMQNDLQKLDIWLKNNKLSLNTKKTKYMIISSKRTVVPPTSITLNNNLIEKVNNIKYLGLIIDSHLTWYDHIQYVIKKINPIVAMFKRISCLLTNFTKNSLYFAHIHSRLIYMLPVWGSTTKTNLGFLQVVQNRAIRRLYGFSRAISTDYMYDKCNLLNLKRLLEYESILMVYKIKTCKLLSNLSLIQNVNKYVYNTRQRDNFALQQFNTMYGKNCFLYYALKLFNSLPNDVKNIISIHIFKKRAKDFICISK